MDTIGGGGNDYTPIISLMQQPGPGSSAHVASAGNFDSGGGGIVTQSFKRAEAPTLPSTYQPPTPHGPVGAAAGGMLRSPLYPENTRQGAPDSAIMQQQPLMSAGQYPAMQPFQPSPSHQPRAPLGGGQELPPNPRLDPAGEVFTHVPRVPPASPFAASGFNHRAYMQHQAELADFHESKRRAAQYSRLFQSGLFPFLAGLLFLLFTCTPAQDALLRIFAPFGLVSESGGGFTLAGKVVLSVLFGVAFSFGVYLA